jgi:uncharacterized protein Usg
LNFIAIEATLVAFFRWPRGSSDADKALEGGRHRVSLTEGLMHVATSMQRQLHGYRLTTAEILYHLPDHPAMLQSYIWQELDLAPAYPVLRKFLDFWRHGIEGRLHSVRVASVGLISPGEVRYTEHLRHLH